MRSVDSLQLGRQAPGGERRRDPAQRGVGRRAGQLGDAVEPRLVDAGGRQRLGQAPRLGDAERLELRRAARPRRRRRRARRARVAPSRRARAPRCCSATSPAASSRSTPDSTKRASRRADDVQRLGHARAARAAGGGGRVVELVRQAGGHRAQRRQPLAVLLDAGDAAHHRARPARITRRAPAGCAKASRRKSARPRRPRAGSRVSACMRTPSGLAGQRPRSRPSRSAPPGGRPARLRPVARSDRLRVALEQQQQARRLLALLGDDLARLRR